MFSLSYAMKIKMLTDKSISSNLLLVKTNDKYDVIDVNGYFLKTLRAILKTYEVINNSS